LEHITVYAVDKVLHKGKLSLKAKEKLLNEYKKKEPRKTLNIPYTLKLAIGIKYMVVHNSAVSDGIFNGSIGTLQRIDKFDNEITLIWLKDDLKIRKETRKQY